jgi:DNA polymerase-3 subunit delta
MKIAPRAAEVYLAKPDAGHRAVLFYGPDSGLARERAKRLTATFLGANPDPFALVQLTGDKLAADPALLADEIAAISMLAPKRVILVEDAGDKLTRVVESAADSFHDGAFLIVCADELSTRSSLRAYFEKENHCAAIACYKDEARDVQEFIRKALAGASVGIERDAMEYLSQQLGNDRGVTRQEVEKLITYAGGGGELRLEEVMALVDYNRDTGFDDMANAVAGRDLPALEKTLTLLLHEGTSPVAYLRALQRYFNRLYYIKAKMNEGQSAEAVIHGLRPPVFFRQVPQLTRHAQSWDTSQIVKALKLLIAAELACKTSDLPPVPASSRRIMQVAGIR